LSIRPDVARIKSTIIESIRMRFGEDRVAGLGRLHELLDVVRVAGARTARASPDQKIVSD